MGIVTIRVDNEVKRRMKGLSHVNWSEVTRRAIMERIEEGERWRKVDHKRLLQASSLNDALRRRVEGWDSVAEIRRWKECGGHG